MDLKYLSYYIKYIIFQINFQVAKTIYFFILKTNID